MSQKKLNREDWKKIISRGVMGGTIGMLAGVASGPPGLLLGGFVGILSTSVYTYSNLPKDIDLYLIIRSSKLYKYQGDNSDIKISPDEAKELINNSDYFLSIDGGKDFTEKTLTSFIDVKKETNFLMHLELNGSDGLISQKTKMALRNRIKSDECIIKFTKELKDIGIVKEHGFIRSI